jgi:hypothetical protein
MVVLVRSFGNHSNTLFQNLHIEAFCIENNIPYFNAAIFNMARLFEFPYKYWLGIGLTLFFRILKILHIQPCRFLPFKDFIDEKEMDSYRKFLLRGRDKLVFAGGWQFRAYDLVSKHSELLKDKYSIKRTNDGYQAICERIKEFDVVLGVHIRQGDFRTWQGGKYFYDYATYKRLIDEFIGYQNGKRTIVIYFSDKELDTSRLNCPVEYIVSKNKYYIDYKIMGKCNYLIGPPSTFTAWASFVYNVPYMHIEHADQRIKMNDFTIKDRG